VGSLNKCKGDEMAAFDYRGRAIFRREITCFTGADDVDVLLFGNDNTQSLGIEWSN
jgi:hypothetical protein